jgi:hypothetical protein
MMYRFGTRKNQFSVVFSPRVDVKNLQIMQKIYSAFPRKAGSMHPKIATRRAKGAQGTYPIVAEKEKLAPVDWEKSGIFEVVGSTKLN